MGRYWSIEIRGNRSNKESTRSERKERQAIARVAGFGFYQVDHTTTPKVTAQEEKQPAVIKKTTSPQATKQNGKIVKAITTKHEEKSKVTPSSNIVKGDVYDIVGAFIPKREGRLHLCAYKDHTRYSIGYGTKSYAGECITESEAIKRFKDATARRVERVVRDYPGLLPYQHAALVSLFYNCNSCYLRVGKTVEKGDFNRSAGIVAKFPGLKKRTRAEQDLYFYGVMY